MEKPRLFLTLTLVVMLSTACTRAQVPDAGAGKPAEAAMSLDELQDRLIEYADSLKEPEEAWKERFASMLGVRFTLDSPGGAREVANRALADGYSFAATTMPSKNGFVRGTVLILLPDGTTQIENDIPECVWDADDLTRRLEGIGFVNRVQLEFRQGWERIHWRPIRDGGAGLRRESMDLQIWCRRRFIEGLCIWRPFLWG